MASSSSAAIPDEVKRNVRAVLLSKIGGVPMANFIKDYKALLGSPFPYIKLGFSNLRQALQAMPDCVRFEIKNDEQYLFGIADQSSFMSSFAIKAQFPEFDEKKDRRKRNKNKRGGGKEESRNRTSRNHQDRHRQSNHQDKQRGQSQMSWQPKQETMHSSSGASSSLNNPVSKKYPDLVGNMKGMYSVVVCGTTQENLQNVEMLFGSIGPVAERSHSGSLLFFRFKNLQHAETVIDTYDGYQMGQNRLRVEPAKEKKPSQPPRTQKFGDDKKTQQLQDFAVFQQQQQQSQQRQQQQHQQNQHQHQNNHQQHQQQTKQQQHQPQHTQQHRQPHTQHQQQHQQHNHIQNQQQQSPKSDGLLNLEDKISEINAALMSRMQLPNNTHIPVMHVGNLPNMVTPVNMVNATSVNMVNATPLNMVNATPLNMVNATSVNMVNATSSVNMVKDTRLSAENTQTKKPNLNHVGKSSNPGSSNSSHHKCRIKVSNIANSLLEKDIQSILETYKPEKIEFKYPHGSHTSYYAIVHLTMRDAERAIQELNGKVKYDIPLSVKPFTMRNPGKKKHRRQPRQRNQSDTSSVGDSAASSAATDDVEPAKDGFEFGDQGADEGEDEGPTLADFAARFSNVTI